MGCPTSKHYVENDKKYGESQPHKPIVTQNDPKLAAEDITLQNIDEWLKLQQEHNLKKMTEEIKNDVHLFVLNNLLMSVQFFDNFERSNEAAREFKREKESEITNSLAEEPQDGQIIGDRKCHLIHGMGHILSKNIIYRPSDRYVEENLYATVQNRNDPIRSTFMCENILPLEFVMTWDNLDVHDESQWDSLHSAPYESASGSARDFRFCLEVPDEKNKVPKGYVRLRCVDLPISMRPQLSLMHVPDSQNGYVYDYSEMSEKVSEVQSDSDGIPQSDDSDSIDGDFMEDLKNRTFHRNNQPSSSKTANKWDGPKKVQIDIFSGEKLGRKDSGVKHVPKFNKGQLLKSNSEVKINVDPSTPKIEEENGDFDFTYSKRAEEEDLDENFNVTKYLLPLPSDRWPKSLPKIPSQTSSHNISNERQKAREPNSSGYETGSQTSVASRSSSVITLASEEIRDNWRSTELKRLIDYPQKNRRKTSDKQSKPEPLSSLCFINIKREIESDDEPEDDETDEDEDDDEEKKPEQPAETEIRTYLNSSQFSADYCSEFHYIAPRHGVPMVSVSNAVVLGTTVRCAASCSSDSLHIPDDDQDDGSELFSTLHTFTPSLSCKSWPMGIYYPFNKRMTCNKDREDLSIWPNFHLVEAIESAGCTVIPLGCRSIEFFNTKQSLEWKLDFPATETLLLNTFKHVHWRAYTFSALLFRAFLAPLGPQGLGLEHLRNILYFMCHEEFVSWNDEQPGLHVRALFNKLYEYLGKCIIPSFFMADHNLLKNIPPQNTRLVQGHLSKIRDNLIVYFIYAFRNLTVVNEETKFYPMPQFDLLYKILTVPTKEELLQMIFPLLMQPDDSKEEALKEIRKKNKKKSKIQTDLIANQDVYEEDFRTTFANKGRKVDKVQQRFKRRRQRFEEKEKLLKEQRKREKIADFIPESERRKSIDLECLPIVQAKFTSFRLVLIIDFFIKHFLNMARKSNEFRAYSQATMYVLQVENLCKILQDTSVIRELGLTSVSEDDITHYLNEVEHLKNVIGSNTRSYITSKFPFLETKNVNYPFAVENYGTRMPGSSSNVENWKLTKLPTPPESVNDTLPELDRKDSQTVKKFEAPQLGKSLQSIPSEPRRVTRAESIKFLDNNKPIVFKPKSYSRSNSREPATFDDESTDL